jgi:L-iditol 2-dehydrogenase
MTVPVLSAPATFSFIDVPQAGVAGASALQPGRALVRVLAGGICGSDLPFFRGAPVPAYAGVAIPPPGYPMHEIVGDVVAMGATPPGADVLVPGTRVVGWATGFDGMADHVVTEASSLAPCPVGLTPEDAVLLQPLACVLYAVERIGAVAGRHCAVLGLGPIGLLFCHVLKQRGASLVTGVDSVDRRDVAAAFGVDAVIWANSANWVGTVEPGTAPSVVVEAVGHQVTTLQHALEAVAPSGTIFYFGVNDDRIYPLDMELMLRKNLTLMSGGTLERRRVLLEAARYLEEYPELVKQSVTHYFLRSEVQRAYEAAAAPAVGRLKVVMTVAQGSL